MTFTNNNRVTMCKSQYPRKVKHKKRRKKTSHAIFPTTNKVLFVSTHFFSCNIYYSNILDGLPSQPIPSDI